MSGRLKARPAYGRNGEPVTVLYTAWAPFFSGAERALLILVEHLDRSKYRPVVAVGTHGELETELRSRGIATAYVPVTYTGAGTLPRWLLNVGRLISLARKERAAIIHANDVPSFQPAGYAARWLRRPAITHVRFPDSRTGYEWFLKPGFDLALFVSADQRDGALQEAPELFGGRSEVVYDGVNIRPVPDAAERRAVRAELGLPIDRTVVALTGQVAEVKGLWEFIDAAGILIGRGVPVAFAVLGDDLKGKGELRVRAERLVHQRGLGEHVRFLGFRTDAPRVIPAFDIIAVPSHVEPLGLAALEGMAAGLAVVGSRVGGIKETVVDGETGLLVPSRSAERLAEAIETLVLDPDRRQAFGRAGRARASQEFSAAAHVRRMHGVYDRLLAS